MLIDQTADKRRIKSSLNQMLGILRSTISRQIQKWNINFHWDVADVIVHGSFYRIFTDEQESNINEFINSNYIKGG